VLYFGTIYIYSKLLCKDLVLVRFCRDYDGKVTPEEVASAAMYLKDTLGKEGIQELISNLSKDKEKVCSSFMQAECQRNSISWNFTRKTTSV
ncbi:LETM1 and EF-hand domain-containing protein 1 mitochondrial-like, partial [Trifolium medium]|nr:LETM1 and EF-hand domain-containing protein 1 mitochondrial-like [Trifolium medium]